MLSDNNDIDIKQEIGGKRNLRTYCIGCGFKNFEASNKEELSDLGRRLNYKHCYIIVLNVGKMKKVKTQRFQRQIMEKQNFYQNV